jgi:hypothetical protein
MKLFLFLLFNFKVILIFSQNGFAYVEIREEIKCFKFDYYNVDSTTIMERIEVDCEPLFEYYSCDETFYFPNSRKLKTNPVIFDKKFNLLINKNMILSYLNSNVNFYDSSIVVILTNSNKTLFPGDVFVFKDISDLKMINGDTIFVSYNYNQYHYVDFMNFRDVLMEGKTRR